MSVLKLKGQALYEKMKLSREQLVKKYTSGGTIRYDEAIGLIPVGGNPAVSQAAATVGGAPVANNGRREKRVNNFREDGTLTGNKVVLDFDAIKAANIADGIPSGSMMDALKKRAEGKTILLFANDAALRWGSVILGEVPCMIKLQDDITGAIRNGIFPSFGTVGGANTGLIHSLPGLVENENLLHRGFFKFANYRGDQDYLKNPVSIWSTTDASRQSIMLFGVNSEIRMWGDSQVIDLNGKRIGAHERPNRVAAFSCIIDLSDGHFLGLSTKGATNAHIFSSVGKGRLARNNHFGIRGHMVKGLLVEGVLSGDANTLNHGSYFGTAILNDSSEVVFKDVHQEMTNKAVANSSLALSWYAQLTMSELIQGYFETPTTFGTGAAYPWMKWENIAVGATDTFGNGKTTILPVFKTEAELVTAGVPADKAAGVRKALLAMDAAYHKSMKAADDTYIQTNTGHGIIGKTFAMVNNIMTDVNQIPRSVNLVAQNPKNADGVRYPDSVAYGFRVGSTDEGVGPLATGRGGSTVEDIYVLNCSFAGLHLSPMEAMSLGIEGKGKLKAFNGMALRPFGYQNSITDAASVAPAAMLLSKEALEEGAPKTALEEKPVDAIDTAAKAVANYTGSSAWTAKKASGLYKGNDVLEMSLATLEAVGLLKKYFTAAAPRAVLSGTDNSAVDLGILAWRKSMMTALGAYTANQIGLKGGFKGDIIQGHLADGTLVDTYAHGEIYPWLVKEDGSVNIDKDVILTQTAVAASPTKDRTLSSPYLAAALPDLSDSIFKLKIVDGETIALVTADTETPVTYAQCATLLGFEQGSVSSPADMSQPVVYKMLRSLDGQNHVHKGAFGVRVDQSQNVLVSGVVVKDIEMVDVAHKPIQGISSVQQQIDFGICPEERPHSGVLDIHGVSLNGVSKALVEDILVEECHAGGEVFGVSIAGKSSDVQVEGVEVHGLISETGGEFAYPIGQQKAVGVRIAKGSSATVKKVKAEALTAEHSGLAKAVEIEDLG